MAPKRPVSVSDLFNRTSNNDLASSKDDRQSRLIRNNQHLAQAIQYLLNADSGEDSPKVFIDRVNYIDEHLIHQLPHLEQPYDSRLYRKLRASVLDVQRDFASVPKGKFLRGNESTRDPIPAALHSPINNTVNKGQRNFKYNNAESGVESWYEEDPEWTNADAPYNDDTNYIADDIVQYASRSRFEFPPISTKDLEAVSEFGNVDRLKNVVRDFNQGTTSTKPTDHHTPRMFLEKVQVKHQLPTSEMTHGKMPTRLGSQGSNTIEAILASDLDINPPKSPTLEVSAKRTRILGAQDRAGSAMRRIDKEIRRSKSIPSTTMPTASDANSMLKRPAASVETHLRPVPLEKDLQPRKRGVLKSQPEQNREGNQESNRSLNHNRSGGKPDKESILAEVNLSLESSPRKPQESHESAKASLPIDQSSSQPLSKSKMKPRLGSQSYTSSKVSVVEREVTKTVITTPKPIRSTSDKRKISFESRPFLPPKAPIEASQVAETVPRLTQPVHHILQKCKATPLENATSKRAKLVKTSQVIYANETEVQPIADELSPVSITPRKPSLGSRPYSPPRTAIKKKLRGLRRRKSAVSETSKFMDEPVALEVDDEDPTFSASPVKRVTRATAGAKETEKAAKAGPNMSVNDNPERKKVVAKVRVKKVKSGAAARGEVGKKKEDGANVAEKK